VADDVSFLASELTAVAARLREAADGGLTRELLGAISRASEPIIRDIRAGLRDHMPDRYAATLEPDLALNLYRRLRTADASVTLRASNRGAKQRKLRRLEGGVLAHPLFGDRSRWFNQTDGMVPGFFAGPARAAAPRVRADIEQALYDVAEKLAGK
jgi:hypothetical protein